MKNKSKLMKHLWLALLAWALLPSNGTAQDQLRLDVSFENTPIEEAVNQLKKLTGYEFVYQTNILSGQPNVTLKLKDATLKEIMDLITATRDLEYSILNKVVAIRKALPAKQKSNQPQQKHKITGVVIDRQNLPIPGANVRVKNSTKGTPTEIDGSFTIETTQSTNVQLIISFMGMKTQEVVWKGNNIKVVLEDDAMAIEDLVVTGIYERKRESFTGSSTSFTGETLKAIGNQNLLQSLKTLDPSFSIIESAEFGSDPNRLPDIEIRGKSSVIGLADQYGTDPNQPLFILDGFESDLATIVSLTMDRVESITILKDASATAIYGSKAANGVVVVDTKKPKSGKLKLNYNSNYSLAWADLSDYNLMNATEKLEFEKLSRSFGSLENNELTYETYAQYYENIKKDIARGVESYWLSDPLRKIALTNKHTLFVEGGDNSMRYGVTLYGGGNQGVMKESGRSSFGGNVRLMYRKKKLAFTNSLSIDYYSAQRESVAFDKFAKMNPYYRKYDPEGNVVPFCYTERYGNKPNPLYDFYNNNFNNEYSTRITNNFEIDWRIRNELRLRTRIGLTKGMVSSALFKSPNNGEYLNQEIELKGLYTESNGKNFGYDGDIALTYGKLLGEKHMVNVVTGLKFDQRDAFSSKYSVQGFIDDIFVNPTYAAQYVEGSNVVTESIKRSASYYLNAGYSFDNKYLLDATYRLDGSSVFGVDNKFSNTWSVGIGWNIHKEEFMNNIGWVNQLKLRASIGNPGNQNFSDYISTRVYKYSTQSTSPFGNGNDIATWANPGLKWQKTIDRNIGFDALVSKLRLNFDFFVKTTDPLLIYMSVPTSTGTKTIPTNMGEQQTTGVTLNANYQIVRKSNFMWSVNANMRHLESEYRNISKSLELYNQNNQGVNMTRYYDGASPTALWAVRSYGIDPGTGYELFMKKDGSPTFLFDFADEVVVGDSNPVAEGIVGTTLYYKGFSLSINCRYKLGGQEFMKTLYDKVENIPDKTINLDKRALYDRWQNPGDNSKFRKISLTLASDMTSRFVEDNNIITGESISLGYESQGKWIQKIGASSVNMRFYMNDIFRISTIKNERGIYYPFSRSVSFSLGLSF